MRKSALCVWLGLIILTACARAQTKAGETVFQADFNAPGALNGWTGAVKAATLESDPDGGHAVVLEQALTNGPSSPKITLALPVEKLRGARLQCSAQIKAENVAAPPKPYNGVKFMLHIVEPDGESWLQQNNVFGTFEWKPVEFAASVPADAQKVELVLGLEETTGKAWFDDVAFKVLSLKAPRPAQPPTGPMYTGHDEPALRGVMINPRMTADDLRALGTWHVNLIRWQLAWFSSPSDEAGKADLARYDAWLEKSLAHLDEMLPLCEKLGIRVVIDLHSAPGGRNSKNECNIFKEKRYAESFLHWWDKIAQRYKDKGIVWGYDLFNEPVEGVNDVISWQELVTQAAKRVRAIDMTHTIIVEPAPWGNPPGMANFTPLPVTGIVYSVHMYEPHTLTHQGVHNSPTGATYPGQIDGKQWDKEQIRRTLKPVIDFAHDTNAQIYIGEFSCIRWAPDDSAYRYLRDCIDVFEENKWDWSYHAFREWDGWSVEHTSDRNDSIPSATPTNRQQLLESWFAKNTLASPAKPTTIAPKTVETKIAVTKTLATKKAPVTKKAPIIKKATTTTATKSK